MRRRRCGAHDFRCHTFSEDADRGVFVPGLTSLVVKSMEEIDHIRRTGEKNRSVGATKMNLVSSRSHSIFTIHVETSETTNGEQHFRVGKLNMVDLAGSERQSKTGATGERFTEAKNINLSLTALGNVISSLVDSKTRHVPYVLCFALKWRHMWWLCRGSCCTC